jgi:hypothetical protein
MVIRIVSGVRTFRWPASDIDLVSRGIIPFDCSRNKKRWNIGKHRLFKDSMMSSEKLFGVLSRQALFPHIGPSCTRKECL